MSRFIVTECTAPDCRLRFPQPVAEAVIVCPRCGSRLAVAGSYPAAVSTQAVAPRRRVVALLDNLRSAYNVGSALRTANGAGVEAVYLCGTTATPAHPRVTKTALGAEHDTPWHYRANALEAAHHLRAAGFTLLALEGTADAENLLTLGDLPAAVALIVGNELAGVDPAVLALSDRIVAIPMRGVKESLNVAVAFGIACYALTG